MRIMGRGRTGIGYQRTSHVAVKLAIANFEERIRNGPVTERKVWSRRYEAAKIARERSAAKVSRS